MMDKRSNAPKSKGCLTHPCLFECLKLNIIVYDHPCVHQSKSNPSFSIRYIYLCICIWVKKLQQSLFTTMLILILKCDIKVHKTN